MWVESLLGVDALRTASVRAVSVCTRVGVGLCEGSSAEQTPTQLFPCPAGPLGRDPPLPDEARELAAAEPRAPVTHAPLPTFPVVVMGNGAR